MLEIGTEFNLSDYDWTRFCPYVAYGMEGVIWQSIVKNQ